ncbi:MAG TPA: hypothetical protein VF414_05875 [Thermoanaerobaculia bacterium]
MSAIDDSTVKRCALILGCLLVALAPEIARLTSWADLLTPRTVATILAVAGAGLVRSPRETAPPPQETEP